MTHQNENGLPGVTLQAVLTSITGLPSGNTRLDQLRDVDRIVVIRSSKPAPTTI